MSLTELCPEMDLCSTEEQLRGFTSPRGRQQQCTVEEQLRGFTSLSGQQQQEQLRCASAATQELPQQCLTGGQVRRSTPPNSPRNVPTQPPTSPRNLPQQCTEQGQLRRLSQGPAEEPSRRRTSISPNDPPSAAVPISSGKYLSRLASARRLAAAEVAAALKAPDLLLQTAVSEEPLPRAWRRVTARAASPRQPEESRGEELLCSVPGPGAALPSETWRAAAAVVSPKVRRPSPAELWPPMTSSKCCVPPAVALEACCAEGSGYVPAMELGLGVQVEDSLQKSSPHIVEDTDPTVVQRTAEECTRWGLKDSHSILAAKLPSKVLASSPVDGTAANKTCSRTVRPIERLWTAAYAGLQAPEEEVPPAAPWGEPTEATVQHSPGREASLSPEMEQRLRLVFECCSPDSQDAVTYQQVRSACDEHPELAKLLGALICSDRSGKITWSDFKALLATQRTEVVRLSDAEAEAVVSVVFKLCDRKNRGTVALLDVHRVCMRQPAISAFLGLPGGDEGWEEAAEAAFPELFLGDLRKMDLTLFTRRVLDARRSTSSKGSLREKGVVNAGPLPRSVGQEVPESSAAAASSDCGNTTLKHEEEERKPLPEKKHHHHHHHHHKKHRHQSTEHNRESDDSGVSPRKRSSHHKSQDDSSGRSHHHHRRHHHRHDQDAEAGQARSSHHHRSHRSSPEERRSERGSSRSHLERKHHHEVAQPEVRAEVERTRAEASAPSGSLRAAGTVVRQVPSSWEGQRSTKEEGTRYSVEAPKAPQWRQEHDVRLLRTEEAEAVRREARRRTEERELKNQEQEERRRREVEAAAKSARDRRAPQEPTASKDSGRRSSQELEFWRLEAMQRAQSLEQRSQRLAEKKREEEKQQEEQEAKQKREQIRAWREEAVRRSEARERRQSIHARPSSAGTLGKGL